MHSKLDDVDVNRNRTADITYDDYDNKTGINFSTYREITVSEKNKLDIILNIKQYDFNKDLSISFNIPKNYERKYNRSVFLMNINSTVNKILLTFITVFLLSAASIAQSVSDQQQELEKERQELKDAQDLLKKNKQNTRQSLSDLARINSKLDLQERLINNINQQINLLDNTINTSQSDIHHMQFLLDTLKLQYEKSMIYTYKNRSNSDFLNFIFSASSFNDAIKRIAYLKSYRNYHQLQGENILKTEQQLRQQINQLSTNKRKKGEVLETQSKEKDALADQQKEKSQIVTQLKTEGKQLNQQIAAKKKQMQKVQNELAFAIKKARQDAIAKAKSDAAKARKEKVQQDKLNASNNANNNNSNTKISSSPPVVPIVKPALSNVSQGQIELLPTAADVTLNTNFKSNRGSLPWPVDRGFIIMHYGLNELPNGVKVDNPGITIGGEIGTSVRAIFDGQVTAVSNIDDMQMVVLKHGAYFSAYSNLSDVRITKGQTVHTGDVIGKVAVNDEGTGSIDLIISDENNNVNPESWLRHR
ncbi:MAG: peptidoglycan DD-metalloendopeptidase family protein [Ferruginibacter sp.]